MSEGICLAHSVQIDRQAARIADLLTERAQMAATIRALELSVESLSARLTAAEGLARRYSERLRQWEHPQTEIA